MTMTNASKELLTRFPIRKSKQQKAAFRDWLFAVLNEQGYAPRVEEHKGISPSHNVVVGDLSTASVVVTAHYDTCAVMPFPNFITPKSIGLYLLYQLAIVAGFLVVAFGVGFAFGAFSALVGIPEELASLAATAAYWVLLILLIAGPANKHTVNDNTSGVLTLMETMAALPQEQRDKAAFVFFDLEEVGLFGSAAFASKHKKTMQQKLLINFDCVSDGDTVLFVLKKGAAAFRERLEEAFPSNDLVKVEVADKGVIYPSDQANFPVGVGVAALKTSKSGILYMDRIHTKRDTVCREENIEFLRDGAIRLLSMI